MGSISTCLTAVLRKDTMDAMGRLLFLVGATGVLMTGCFGTTSLHERDYQRFWCEKHDGVVEYVLPDRTRVDCLTREYAVEVEYAHKWAESIGQSLFYARMTGKRPGIVLIMREKGDERYLKRLRKVAGDDGIKVWTIKPHDLK